VAGEVARECRVDLLRRVYSRTASMSLAEIRGYVRAQAAGYVEAEVDRAVRCGHLSRLLRSRVTDAAVDQLVCVVAHDAFIAESPMSPRTMAA
jgi:hypothetical protein